MARRVFSDGFEHMPTFHDVMTFLFSESRLRAHADVPQPEASGIVRRSGAIVSQSEAVAARQARLRGRQHRALQSLPEPR